MIYTITKITSEVVEFSNSYETVKVPKKEIDYFAYIKENDTFEIDGEFRVPYSISQERRTDIIEHHADEARNGNI